MNDPWIIGGSVAALLLIGGAFAVRTYFKFKRKFEAKAEAAVRTAEAAAKTE